MVPVIEHAIAGISLALGECKMLCWLVVKTTKSFNIGLMGDAVRDAPIKMGYQDSSSPTPVAYRRGCGHFAGKPLALGEKLCHPSLTTLAAIEQAIAGIALALDECDML
jgi:hypothetical protein